MTRLPQVKLTDRELAALTELCELIPKFMPSVMLHGHRISILLLNAGPTLPFTEFPPHTHPIYEGHVVLGGTASYTMSSPRMIGPGTLLFHGPEVGHHCETGEARLDWFICWLLIDPPVEVPEPPAWPHSPEAMWEMALMVRDYLTQQPGWRERTVARMTTILSYLFEMTGLPEVEHAPPTAEQVSLERIEIYLKQNLEKPLHADDVADYAGISTRSLQRLFQHAYHQGVMARLQTLRLHRAAQLLLESELTVTEISEQVGITGVSYFCRCFHRGFNMTPLQYRAEGTFLPLSTGTTIAEGLIVMPVSQPQAVGQTTPS